MNAWKLPHGTSPAWRIRTSRFSTRLVACLSRLFGQDTNNGGLLYRGSVAWTETAITLRCTTATAAYNVIVS